MGFSILRPVNPNSWTDYNIIIGQVALWRKEMGMSLAIRYFFHTGNSHRIGVIFPDVYGTIVIDFE